MDKTIEIILIASVLMVTALFAMTMFTSSFSNTEGFVNNLYQQAEEKQTDIGQSGDTEAVTVEEAKNTDLANPCEVSDPPNWCP